MSDLDAEFPGCVMPGPMPVKFARLHADAQLPTYATDGSVGLDLYAAESKQLFMGDAVKIDTGIAVELPHGYEAQVRPRSGLSKRGIVCSFGTIDTDYRGSIGVILTAPDCTASVNAGDRIAQLVIMPVPRIEVLEVEASELSATARGDQGFGSTGK